MGLGPNWSSAAKDTPLGQVIRPPNPDPRRFTVLSSTNHGAFWIAVVKYDGCTNFEGRKVLVLRTDPERLLSLDPHFTEGGDVVARFEPSEEGIEFAGKFVLSLRRPK